MAPLAHLRVCRPSKLARACALELAASPTCSAQTRAQRGEQTRGGGLLFHGGLPAHQLHKLSRAVRSCCGVWAATARP